MENQNVQPGPQTMNFIEAIKTCILKYVDFNGRASRAEFWWFYLATVIVGFLPLGWMLSIGLFLPSLAVAWRRLHDINKAGGWFFISMIPIVGWVWIIILYCKAGDPTPNRFGDVPQSYVA